MPVTLEFVAIDSRSSPTERKPVASLCCCVFAWSRSSRCVCAYRSLACILASPTTDEASSFAACSTSFAWPAALSFRSDASCLAASTFPCESVGCAGAPEGSGVPCGCVPASYGGVPEPLGLVVSKLSDMSAPFRGPIGGSVPHV
ncbi:hypothetical protein B4U78_003800 [Microbacterium esteraromaticum]|nr:hypothetical protein B4U78_003800 [Microbacterium esteraromaticum]